MPDDKKGKWGGPDDGITSLEMTAPMLHMTTQPVILLIPEPLYRQMSSFCILDGQSFDDYISNLVLIHCALTTTMRNIVGPETTHRLMIMANEERREWVQAMIEHEELCPGIQNCIAKEEPGD